MRPPAPPEGYSLRHATSGDLASVLAFLRLCDLHDWGGFDTSEEDLRFQWKLPDLDLERDVWLVHDRSGEPVGYIWVLGRSQHTRLDGWGVVHPDHRGRGLGAYLLRLRAHVEAVHAELAPAGRRVESFLGMIGPDRPAHELAERFGYREVRHFWQMLIDLPQAGELPAARWPEGVRMRTFERGRDDRAVHAAIEESFADHWGHVPEGFEAWAKPRLDADWFDPTMWLLAEAADQLAGVLAGAVIEGDGWVITLGVRAPWRGRGIGEALLRESFAEFRRRGLAMVKLDVDAGNETGATRLYERVGMRVNRQYDDYERVVREGSA